MQRELLKKLPAIDQWLMSRMGEALCREFSREEVTSVMRSHLQSVRERVLGGDDGLPDFDSDAYEALLRADLLSGRQISLQPAINATGIVIHTNLGRAPLAQEAINAIGQVSQGYSNLEFELSTGKRGSRYTHVEPMLAELTGAEAAIVVNNCAAAVTLTLSAFASDGEVVISRGELIEIGGSFRMPDVIGESGATMREVGTTNRTTIADYEREMNERTRVLLASHPSNYRVVGFTTKPSLAELSSLARSKNCLCIQDLGSGTLVDLATVGLEAEPTVAECIGAGVDIVVFSGDKLLGGPQAGIICGRRDLLDELRRHPLLRALRIDKLSLAALAATLRLYQPPHDPFEKIPVLRMLSESNSSIEQRSQSLIEQLKTSPKLDAQLEPGASYAGGGSLPMNEIPTTAIHIRVKGMTAEKLAGRLRRATPAVVGRIKDDDFIVDLRTVMPADEGKLVEIIADASA